MRRRSAAELIAAGLAALGVAASALLLASPAYAHNYLISSTPAEGSTVSELPAAFSVTTNEALLDLAGDGSGFALEVTDAGGLFYGDGCVSIVDATLATGASLGDAGPYSLTWQLVSADGHSVSGSLAFEWTPAPGTELDEGSPTPPDCGGTAASNGQVPTTNTAQAVRTDPDLSDVLWIGGALAAVLVAVAVTVLVVSRKPRKG